MCLALPARVVALKDADQAVVELGGVRKEVSIALTPASKMARFSSWVAGMRSLGLRGASVTLPHKETVMACLDYIDPTARRIKAVNTIVNEDGTLKGFNTDCAGALQALAEKTPVAGRQVAVIGAGGAARAVAYGVLSNGGKVCLFNRSREKGEALASEPGADFRLLADFAAERPRSSSTPLPSE